MFISVLDLFKLGIGPSSSHTMGPMVAARQFRQHLHAENIPGMSGTWRIQCVLKGSLALTGKGHGTDKAVALGLNGYQPAELAEQNVDALHECLMLRHSLFLDNGQLLNFSPANDIVFDTDKALSQHPNGMIFELLDEQGRVHLSETWFSIGGGFIVSLAEIGELEAPIKPVSAAPFPYPFDSAKSMLAMARSAKSTIAEMKRANETCQQTDVLLANNTLDRKLDEIWQAMISCIERGLKTEGELPGGLKVKRRAKMLYDKLLNRKQESDLNEWLCIYAMAVNEENAAGHAVVTAPTNGAAGVIPAVLYYFVKHGDGQPEQVREFLLTAAAVGGLIKHHSSISGAEVGCQGEVGSAAAMAAAGLCAAKGGSPKQIENAAEIALEHHLGLTCDPVKGLVQIPCIERNGFGAIKAYAAASLALMGTGEHIMSLDNCIEAMRQTGMEMSFKYKETSLGGLALSLTEC